MTIGCKYNTVPVSEMSQNQHTKYCMYCTYNCDAEACKEFRPRVNGKMIRC